MGEFSSSVLTAPLAAAGFIINLQAVTQKYRARYSAACILQFTPIFLQVSLYEASHFPTLSGSSILPSTLASSTFNLLFRLLLNATQKKNTLIIVLYILTCTSLENNLNRKLVERNGSKHCQNSNRSWLHDEYEINLCMLYNLFSYYNRTHF